MDKGRNSSNSVCSDTGRSPEEEIPCQNQNRRFAKQSALEQESKSRQRMKEKMRLRHCNFEVSHTGVWITLQEPSS